MELQKQIIILLPFYLHLIFHYTLILIYFIIEIQNISFFYGSNYSMLKKIFNLIIFC